MLSTAGAVGGSHHPLRRGRGAAAPEVSEHKAPVAREEVETCEVEAEVRIESSPEMEE